MTERSRGRLARLVLPAVWLLAAVSGAAPRIPGSDSDVLAELPPGTRHGSLPAADVSGSRLDIALPLAQFQLSRARATGDLRHLGYAEAILAPWMRRTPVDPEVLVVHATILQSRHAFTASLAELDRALRERPHHAQAWLVRATVLRVLGRYGDALASCRQVAESADALIGALCVQGVRGLTGHLDEAYAAVAALPDRAGSADVRAWRFSELGEMAERLGRDGEAERWFGEGLRSSPGDFYLRAACADLLLRQQRAAETLRLLAGGEATEPLSLRLAIAHRMLRDGAGQVVEGALLDAFSVEERRGEAVHRREQARFLLDVEDRPAAALAAARENWQVQREPEDALILLRSARAAGAPEAAESARRFLEQSGLEDARLEAYRSAP